VVDWCLAKVIGTPETSGEGTLRPPSASGSSETLPGTAIGTPAFMSPEQAAGDLDRLGPASDVYSLGATLYHVLTGEAPFEGSDIGPILERVRRGDFPPPRQVKPEAPRPLEAICLKAMALRPEERYPDCRALADEIERWLADEPVSAYVEPRPARLARWGRRHRPLVATAVAILATATVGLTAGLVAVSTEKNRTELARQGEARQRMRAEAGEKIARDKEKEARDQEKEARDRELEARAVLDFVQDKILAAARPEGQEGGLGREVTLRKALEAALPQVESSFQGRPLVEASVRSTLGVSFSYLGDAKTAAHQFQIARDRLISRSGPDDPATLASTNNLAITYWEMGRYADALNLHEETLALQKAKLGPDDPDTLKSMNNLAVCCHALGRYAEALNLNEETLELMKAKRGPDHPETLASMSNVAAGYQALGRYADALKLSEQTLALRQAKLGHDHPETLLSMNNLAESYDALGRNAEALALREKTLALRKAKLGPDHPDTLWSMGNFAESLATLDRRSEAVAIIDDCLRRAQGKVVDPRLVPGVLDVRLRACAKEKDASGCRQTAEMWERLDRKDADSLYTAARFRAVTAGILPAGGQTRDAELAIGCLEKAVAAGYATPQQLAHLTRDHDLDALRDRADFRRLLAELFDRGFPADPFAK